MRKFKIKKHINSGLGWVRSKYNKPQHSIKAGYIHRHKVDAFDDSSNTDEWQKEVYEFSKELLVKYNFSKVIDFGCGSGFKLMKHFENYDTLGLELKDAVELLKSKYPKRKWEIFDFKKSYSCDILIMSDVIEHVDDPSDLLSKINDLIDFKVLIISTPDRNTLTNSLPYGPPRNQAHYREWSFAEFHVFINSHFNISSQFISNKNQATQVVECTKRDII